MVRTNHPAIDDGSRSDDTSQRSIPGTDLRIVTPAAFEKTFAERGRIWAQLDTALKEGEKLDKMGKSIKADASGDILGPLTEDNTPVSEVYAATSQLETVLAQISRIEADIATAQAQIVGMGERRTVAIMIGVAVIAVIVLLLLATRAQGF